MGKGNDPNATGTMMPDASALDPAHVRRAFERIVVPSRKLKLSLPDIDPDFDGQPNPHVRPGGYLTAHAEIVQDDARIGHLNFQIDADADGRRLMFIEHLTLRQLGEQETRDRLLRQGRGGALIPHIERSARDLGCHAITLTAIGGASSYTWARWGWDFVNDGERRQAEAALIRECGADQSLRAELVRLRQHGPLTATAVSQFGRTDTAGDWPGRRAIRAMSWRAVKHLR